MVEEDRRHLAPTELLCREQPAVPGDDPQRSIDEDRNIEAEGTYAPDQLADLLGAMRPGIRRVRAQYFDPPPDDREGRAGR